MMTLLLCVGCLVAGYMLHNTIEAAIQSGLDKLKSLL